jgi:hypothetical protein
MSEIPPKPDNESERLEALKRYGVLDTVAEPAFDGLMELASQICGTSIALISLVDQQPKKLSSAQHRMLALLALLALLARQVVTGLNAGAKCYWRHYKNVHLTTCVIRN